MEEYCTYLTLTSRQIILNRTFENYQSCVKCKFYQCKQLGDFIDLQTQNACEDDLIICCGDFNINSRPITETTKAFYRSMADKDPGYLSLIDEDEEETKEYDILTKLLTCNGNLVINDVVRQSFSNSPPATFGVSKINDKGEDNPVETYFTQSHDLCSNQCIDYILEFKRKSYQSKDVKTEKELLGLNSQNSKLQIQEKSCNIEKFEISVSDRPYTQISDHYGLSVHITCQ